MKWTMVCIWFSKNKKKNRSASSRLKYTLVCENNITEMYNFDMFFILAPPV